MPRIISPAWFCKYESGRLYYLHGLYGNISAGSVQQQLTLLAQYPLADAAGVPLIKTTVRIRQITSPIPVILLIRFCFIIQLPSC